MKTLAALKTSYRNLVRRVYAKEILCYRLTASWYRGLTAETPTLEVRTAAYTLPKWVHGEVDDELDLLMLELQAPPARRFPVRLLRQLASFAA